MNSNEYFYARNKMHELLQRDITNDEADELIELALKTKRYEIFSRRPVCNWQAVIAYSLIILITSLLIFLIVNLV